MTLTLNNHIPSLTQSVRKLATFRSQSAKVSEKSIVSTFSIEKPKLPNLTFP